MERELEAQVRVRLRFSDKHLLSKEQRSKGFRRCWAVVRPEIATVGEFSEHIKGFFGLRCASADDLFLSMGGFILPPSESACVFKDKEVIRVQTSISKKKKKIAIIENQTILSIDNGENLKENLNHQKKRKQKDSDNPESSKKKIKNKSHETPAVINTSNNNKSSMTIIDDPSNQKNKQIMVNDDGANEKDEIGPVIGNSVLGLPPSNLMPAGAGPSNWLADQTKNGSNGKKNNWKPKNNYNNQEGPNRKNTWKQWSESNINQNSTNSQLGICNNNNDNNNNINEANKGKNIIQEEDEKSNEDELNFESLYPMVRLPREGDIIAYRLMDSSSGFFDLSQFRVGEVLIFDPIIMEIVLGSVPEYPIFPNGERPNNSLYKEDGTLGVDFGSLVDLRLVKESQIEIAPKGNYSKSGKVKSKNKNKGNNWNNAKENVDNLEAGGNNNANSAWEIGEGSNTKEIEENGWGTWAPSNNKKTTTFGNNNNNNTSNGFGRNNNNYYNNNGYGSRGGFHKRNNGRGGGNNQRNSGWEATEPASNVNETAQQTQENGWDSWQPSTSRAVAGGQNGNFGSRGGFSRGRGRNGRGGKYYNPKFTK